MTKWTEKDIDDLAGRQAVVTGANSGLGHTVALELARHGADVVVAARSEERGRAAVERIAGEGVRGAVAFAQLDLADLGSVAAFAERFLAEHQRLDLLVNNAGVMMPQTRQATRDGFELQLGTNHLGHFALTMRLAERLMATPAARVVTVSSFGHRMAPIDLDDPQSENKRYSRSATYGQSKLANVLFMLELDRRLKALGADTISTGAHPGYAATELQRHSPLFIFLNRFLAQPAQRGAWPLLYAATDPSVKGGDFIGPDGILAMRGHPQRETPSQDARDPQIAARLWALSEELTGLAMPAVVRAAA